MKVGVRIQALVVSLLAGAGVVGLATLLISDTLPHEMLFGGQGEGAPADAAGLAAYYPFTIQNLMWLMFFVGFGEIWVRMHNARKNQIPMRDQLLPEDSETMLRADDLGPIYRRVNERSYPEDAFLPRLISRTVLQFQSSRSVDQANTLMNTTLELCQHEVDLRYNMLRYLVWLIPTLGFLGTVISIARALGVAGDVQFDDQELMQAMMPRLISELGVAFYTTFVALLQSAVLVFALHIAQAREERILNRAGQYCLDNLINRLYEK